ncbi:hypothetical protein [Desulfobacter curvatus]|uniref:hypothetical protein n=1 Tax=Desulfobacter curvatus TaxID=2290 RepID=UPI00036DE592|nr:hypothetical protein [Desulfobacter curvatus]
MDKTLSLLPYLESGRNGILLDIHVSHQDNPKGDLPSFTFETAGIEKPFTRLVKGGLKCEGSNRVFHPVFMLIQKDTYFSDREPFNPQTNTTLDQAWLDTIQFFSQDYGTFTIPAPPDHEPTQLKPLFYCKFKDRFFHPPCPDCGRELILCKNDAILEKAGLDSFHTSLSRYLFCPECYESNSTHFFYTYTPQADDPAGVLDRHGLIKRFSKMKTTIPDGFPCADCPEHSVCYLAGQKALSRIGFLSFYPFYMLVFDACSINGTQFLQHLSNAPETVGLKSNALSLSPGTPQSSGHDPTKYLFGDDPRFWLEILFLKYAFFKKILTSIEKRLNDQFKPVFNLNMDSIWINTKSDAGMMPFFWDYELYLIDLVSTRPMDLFQTSMANNRQTNFIAQLCLYIFFVNNKHTAKTVFQSGADLLQSTDETEWANNAQALFNSHPIFKPENIFWEPAPADMAESWHDLWIQTIHFAGSLIKEKEILDFPAFIKHCIRQVNEILTAVKSELFSKDFQIKQKPVMPVAGAAEQDEPETIPSASTEDLHEDTQANQAITTILKQLKTKWEKEASPEPSQEEDVMETLVLSSTEEGIKPSTDFSAKKNKCTEDKSITPSPMADQHEFEQMQKTIILNRQGNIDPAPSDFEDIQKTIVMNTYQKTKTTEPEKDFNDLEKTVIVSFGNSSQPENRGDFFNEDDDLDKTVILPPKK